MSRLYFFIFIALNSTSVGICIRCYECDNCLENPSFLENSITECPDDSYVSCLKTEARFARYIITSRSCSQAPSLNQECTAHMVNIMQAKVCICGTPLCNGMFAQDVEYGYGSVMSGATSGSDGITTSLDLKASLNLRTIDSNPFMGNEGYSLSSSKPSISPKQSSHVAKTVLTLLFVSGLSRI